MPTATPTYVERLSIRPRWWAVVLAVALLGSAELFAGFGLPVIAIVLTAVLVPTVLLLALAGRTVLRVDETGLHVHGRTLSYDQMESVEALDQQQTRLRAGPEADPAARLVLRGYIRESVVVRPMDATAEPYWLVSTRHPHDVVAAVERCARATFSRG
jgi:Protein of unknown function (DUF3093)